ncbi:MAG: hypothetical protein QXU01_01325 [Candidatus Hadarchaeales archaeon]
MTEEARHTTYSGLMDDTDIGIFLSTLKKRDLKQARAVLEEKLAKVNSEFERGILHALEGMLAAIEGNQTFSAVWKLLENKPDLEFLKRLEKDLEEHISKPFISEREKGYFSAWLSLIRRIISS